MLLSSRRPVSLFIFFFKVFFFYCCKYYKYFVLRSNNSIIFSYLLFLPLSKLSTVIISNYFYSPIKYIYLRIAFSIFYFTKCFNLFRQYSITFYSFTTTQACLNIFFIFDRYFPSEMFAFTILLLRLLLLIHLF